MPSVPYAIRQLTARDSPQLVDFLRRFFLRDEPLNAAMGIMANGRQSWPEQERFLLEPLSQDVSLQAVDTMSGKIMGVFINHVHQPGHEGEAVREVETCPDPAFREILRFTTSVDLQVSEKLRALFPDVHLHRLEIVAGSVDPAARNCGIGIALVEHTKQLAMDQGIPLVRVDCSSVFSAKGIERCGFQKIFSIRYDSYKCDGKILFPPTKESGDEYITYVKRITPRPHVIPLHAAANMQCHI
ncbi:arylalkylamine N-acetyltransferase 1-like isoform X1 [Schistocerca serialis cubense]|uniref:arylalkylamine N-acetyltransferase 1-like isoform X1 n=1 Tax=Schistocerca serialis cubense TaxID=2023355 RepID=UPI00214EC4DC|nr:arylalkylamine N-acetyltransferase 1-like isoform X1 [Schistocerca serialis cubense]